MEDILCNHDNEAQMRALQDTLYVLGGKWKLPIVSAIFRGNKRYREIERSIPGITTRMLSKELKELEINKLVTRKVYDTTPVKIEYELSSYCMTFCPVVHEMIIWGIEHRKQIRGR